MELNLDSYKALLFDFDGTLIDSMPLHNQAWIEILAAKNCPMTEEILNEYAGVPNRKTVALFNERFGWNLDPEKATQEKEARFQQMLPQVAPIDWVVKIARENQKSKSLAIVTGSPRELVDKLLTQLNLKDLFPVIISSEDTPKHKPDPEPFLLAAKKLNVAAKECLVFEDAALGMQAAKAAGMDYVQVTSAGSVLPAPIKN